MAITLIGLPSSGKSTLGVLLAKSLGYQFIDADLVIQEKTGKLLYEIINEIGVDGFIELENEINQTISGNKVIIATGGSAIYGKEAMEHFKSLGKVVYIKISFDELEKRLGDYTHRGIAIKEGTSLKELYLERTPLYEKYADVTIDGCDTVYKTIKKIERLLK